MARLSRQLAQLLNEPQTAEHAVRKIRNQAQKAGVAASISATYKSIGIRGRLSKDKSSGASESVEATFTRTKMDGLFAAVPAIRTVLLTTMEILDGRAGYVILDDFYHVSTSDQPSVLSYLHQVVKNTPISLKICGVRHLLNTFVDTDPPLGMQIGQDAAAMDLDVTLGQFQTAQDFLEKVLDGVCSDMAVRVDDIASSGGRTKLILASGGVARDYLSLVQSALRNANARAHNPSRPHNRVTAEDVNKASAALQTQKQEDLQRDAGPDAEAIRQRFSDVSRFCLDFNSTNVFLIEGPALDETAWGKEIGSLADLRLVHEIDNVSIQSSDYRGRRFVAFTLDLSSYTVERSEHIRQIEFWTSAGRSDIRRVGLIYRPDRSSPDANLSPLRTTKPVDWVELPLPFDGDEAAEA